MEKRTEAAVTETAANAEKRETETVTIGGSIDDSPWEGCLNSVNYRIRRGVPVEVPRAVAELIRRSEAEKRRSDALLARFASGDGVRL